MIGLPSFACHFRGFFHQSNHVDVLKLRKLTRIELIVVGIQVIYLVEKTYKTAIQLLFQIDVNPNQVTSIEHQLPWHSNMSKS